MNVLVGVRQLVDLPCALVQADVVGDVGEAGERVGDVQTESLLLELEVAFLGTVLARPCIGSSPVHHQVAEKVLSAEREVHGLLEFETGVVPVMSACLGLNLRFRLVVGSLLQVLVGDGVAVFPVVTPVVDTLEEEFVVGVDIIVEREGVTLALTGDVVLSRFGTGQELLPIVVEVILELHIVRTDGCVLVGDGSHDAQPVVEEAVAVGQSEVQLRVLADPVVAAAECGVEGTFVG